MSSLPGRKLFSLLTAVAVVLASASLVIFYYQSIRNFFKFAEIDFTSYLRASTWFFNGMNPYEDVARRYLYPQFLLVALYPLTWLQQGALLKGISIGFWSLGSFLSFFLVLAATWKRLLNLPTLWAALKRNYREATFLVLMLHPFLQDEFLNGQVNLYVLGCTAAYFFLLEKNRLAWAAFFLAIAASIKIAPALCLLYVLVSRQYRVVFYFLLLLVTFNIILPYVINTHSLEYYQYYLDQVAPEAAGNDFQTGFRSFSLLATFSYVFKITWSPLARLVALSAVVVLLCLPIIRNAPSWSHQPGFHHRFVFLAAAITVIPLSFPVSEAHHLLLQTIPYLAVLAYWKELYDSGQSLVRDKLSLIFLAVVVGHHAGHGLKNTPIRLICLLTLYFCFLVLLKRLNRTGRVTPTAVSTAESG